MAKELLIGLAIGATLQSGFTSTFSRADKLIKQLGNSLQKANERNFRTSNSIKKLEEKRLALQEKIKLATASGDKSVVKLQQSYEQLQRRMQNLVSTQDKFTAAIKRSEKAQKSLKDTADKQKQLKQERRELGGKLKNTAIAATSMGMAGWGVMKTYMEQEEAENNLKITMMKADGSFGQFKEVAKIASQLGTDLPGTKKDFYALAQAMKSQGVTDKTLVNGGLKTSAQLNVLLDMDQASGGEFFAKMMEAHGLSEQELPETADMMQRAMFAAGLNKEQMYGAMTYYASNVRSMKLTGKDNTEKLLAIQGMAAQQGLEGTSFGTNFSTLLDRMNKGPKMMESAKKGMKAEAAKMMKASKVNFNFWDKKGNFKGIDGMIAELEKLNVIRAKFGDEGAGLVAEELFGVEGKRIATLLAEKGAKGLDEFIQKMKEQASLQDRIALKTSTLSSAMEALGGVWESAVGTLGSAFAKDIKDFANVAQGLIENTLTPWIEKNKTLIKYGAGIVGGLIAIKMTTLSVAFAFSGLRSAMLLFTLPIKSFKAAKAVFELGRLTKATTGLSVAGKVFSGLQKGFGLLSSGLVKSSAWAWSGITKAWGGITKVISASAAMATRFAGMMASGLAKGTGLLAKAIGNLAGMAVRFAGLMATGLAKGAGLLAKALLGAGKAVLFLGRALLMNPIGLAITAIALGAYLIYRYWEPIKGFFINLWNSISQRFAQASAWLRSVWSSVTTWFSTQWETLKTYFSNGIQTVTGFISQFNPIAAFETAWSAVSGWVTNAWTSVTSFFNQGVTNLSTVISQWNPLTLFTQAMSGVLSYFGIDLPASFSNFGKNIIDGLVAGISSAWAAAKEKVAELGAGVKSWFKEKLGINSPSRVFMGFGRNTVEGLVIGLNKAMPQANAASQQLADTVSITPTAKIGVVLDNQPIKRLIEDKQITNRVVENQLVTKELVEKKQVSQNLIENQQVTKRLVEDKLVTNKLVENQQFTKNIVANELVNKQITKQEYQQMSNERPARQDTQRQSYQPLFATDATAQHEEAQPSINVDFNPTINVTTSASGATGVVNQVQDGLKMSLHELERLLERVMDQKMRRAY